MIRTYYWHDRVIPSWKIKVKNFFKNNGHRYFTIGNAGDLLTKCIIEERYSSSALNVKEKGGRLLLVGSIAHKIREGDMLCGIGTQGKSEHTPKKSGVIIHGLRGPISYEEFKRKGYDVSNVKFLLDPGLLVRYMYNDNKSMPVKGKAIFIPHYLDRTAYRGLPKGISLVDMDAHPRQICQQILSAEHVFSSSLHGIVFSHALCRPATLVEPKKETLLKFKDYYASIGLDMPVPLRGFEGNPFSGLATSPQDLSYKEEDFYFPSKEELLDRGILLNS